MKRGFSFLRRGGLGLAIASMSLGAIVSLGLLLGASEVSAETVQVISTVPAADAVLPSSPPAITVTFDQQIGSAATAVIVCNGNAVPQAAATVSADLLSLNVDLTAIPLPKGECNVRWSVIALTESAVQSETFSFRIEEDAVAVAAPTTVADAAGVTSTPTATGAAAADADATDDEAETSLGGPLGLARLVSMLSVLILLGAVVLITVAWPEGIEYILTIRFIRLTWLAAISSTIVMVVCLTAQASGTSFTDALNPTTWGELTDTTPGIAALARVVLVAMTGWVALRPERTIDPTTQLPALALPALAVATMGFSRTGGDLQLIGYAAGVAHALAVGVWLGGLVLLGRVVLAGPGEDDLVHAVRGFGRLSTPAMLVAVVTGAVQLYRMDAGHLSDTTHGRLMVLKVVPVIAMVVIGTATRQFVHRRMSRTEVMTTPLAARLRRAVGFEALLGVLILVITSWMLSTQPGNLVVGARSSADFAAQLELADATGTLDAKLSLHPARVGQNEMLLEITEPVADISLITVTFVPPASATGANLVTLTITELRGAGAAYIAPEVGVPLDAAGAWNVTVEITTPTGVLKQSKLLNVRADGSTRNLTIPPVDETPVTAAPTSSTTIASG